MERENFQPLKRTDCGNLGREGDKRNANGVAGRAKMRICRAAVQIQAAVHPRGKENAR